MHNDAGYSLPGIVELDLGANHDITGFSYLANPNNTKAKVLDYEIYTSDNGIIWDNLEAAGQFYWEDIKDISIKEVYFGAITARYVQVKYLSNTNYPDKNIHTNELVIFENVGASTGQKNQTVTFVPVPVKGTTSADFEITATSNSELEVAYEIVSGPATVNGNIISLTGDPGIVKVKATQAGDETYYASEATHYFEVLDLFTYEAVVSTPLTEDYPIEMESLKAYPIYVNASVNAPDGLINIQEVNLEIDGDVFTAEESNGLFYYLWTPTSFGNFQININTVLDNGSQTTITRNIEVVNTASSQVVEAFQDVIIQYGGQNSRWYYGTYTLPQFVGTYDNINALLEVECPQINGFCDDWDRDAQIDIKGPDGNWIQIIRYVTPFGVGCNHQIDLTDYMSLLQGEVEFRIFINTWGTGGWQLSLDLDYQKGTPEYDYSQVVEVWDGSYDFGDPSNLQPVKTFNANIIGLAKESYLRLSTTGHRWGETLNTGNAAEFYNATHYIDVDSQQTFIQNLWNDCDPNPDNCTGQRGTWQHDRAGWCPGAIAPPDIYDLNSFIGKSIDLDYRFDPSYVDLCHPNNPDCKSGVYSCPDCNDTFNPLYIVDAHIINKSDQPLFYGDVLNVDSVDNTLIYDFTVYPNPTDGLFSISAEYIEGKTNVSIHTIDGRQVKAYFFDSKEQLLNYKFNLSNLTSGVYFINIENAKGTGAKKIILK